MKALFNLTVIVGLLISSTSSAFCLKAFSKNQNRFISSYQNKDNFQPGSAVKTNNVVQSGTARK